MWFLHHPFDGCSFLCTHRWVRFLPQELFTSLWLELNHVSLLNNSSIREITPHSNTDQTDKGFQSWGNIWDPAPSETLRTDSKLGNLLEDVVHQVSGLDL